MRTADALTLYLSPGACSRVTLVALETAGLSYAARRVGLPQGEQRSAAYLALNPKGKVPLLVTPEGPLSENLAILSWLDAQAPAAALLPPAGETYLRAKALSWLAFSVSTLHPQLYRARMTARIHPDTATHEGIRAAALAEMRQQLAAVDQTLAAGRPWLMGERWCIADAHVSWAVDRACSSGLSLDGLPHVAALLERQMAQPAWQTALAREASA